MSNCGFKRPRPFAQMKPRNEDTPNNSHSSSTNKNYSVYPALTRSATSSLSNEPFLQLESIDEDDEAELVVDNDDDVFFAENNNSSEQQKRVEPDLEKEVRKNQPLREQRHQQQVQEVRSERNRVFQREHSRLQTDQGELFPPDLQDEETLQRHNRVPPLQIEPPRELLVQGEYSKLAEELLEQEQEAEDSPEFNHRNNNFPRSGTIEHFLSLKMSHQQNQGEQRRGLCCACTAPMQLLRRVLSGGHEEKQLRHHQNADGIQMNTFPGTKSTVTEQPTISTVAATVLNNSNSNNYANHGGTATSSGCYGSAVNVYGAEGDLSGGGSETGSQHRPQSKADSKITPDDGFDEIDLNLSGSDETKKPQPTSLLGSLLTPLRRGDSSASNPSEESSNKVTKNAVAATAPTGGSSSYSTTPTQSPLPSAKNESLKNKNKGGSDSDSTKASEERSTRNEDLEKFSANAIADTLNTVDPPNRVNENSANHCSKDTFVGSVADSDEGSIPGKDEEVVVVVVEEEFIESPVLEALPSFDLNVISEATDEEIASAGGTSRESSLVSTSHQLQQHQQPPSSSGGTLIQRQNATLTAETTLEDDDDVSESDTEKPVQGESDAKGKQNEKPETEQNGDVDAQDNGPIGEKMATDEQSPTIDSEHDYTGNKQQQNQHKQVANVESEVKKDGERQPTPPSEASETKQTTEDNNNKNSATNDAKNGKSLVETTNKNSVLNGVSGGGDDKASSSPHQMPPQQQMSPPPIAPKPTTITIPSQTKVNGIASAANNVNNKTPTSTTNNAAAGATTRMYGGSSSSSSSSTSEDDDEPGSGTNHGKGGQQKSSSVEDKNNNHNHYQKEKDELVMEENNDANHQKKHQQQKQRQNEAEGMIISLD